MNLWQICRQAQYLLQQAVWSGGDVIFAPESVICAAADSDLDALDANLVLPLAVIVPGGGQADPQASDLPSYWVRDMTVVLAVRNFNDRTGQAPVMGAARVGITDSRGRGLLEIEQPLLETLERLVSDSGVTIALKSQSAVATRLDQSDRVYALKEYVFEVSCTSTLFYPPARRLTATSPGAGQAALSWENPPARYDRYRLVLRRATGASPPSTPTSGTGVTLAGNIVTSALETGLAAGTYSYALFVMYDDFTVTNNAAAPGSDVRYSEALTKSGLVVS